jgi:hypothetical protein
MHVFRLILAKKCNTKGFVELFSHINLENSFIALALLSVKEKSQMYYLTDDYKTFSLYIFVDKRKIELRIGVFMVLN